jgi:hypothetical protein
MIGKPQKWIAQTGPLGNTLRLCWEKKKGAAKRESSSLQPGFEDEEDFHRNHLWL